MPTLIERGARVQLHPAHGMWMRGARYGEVLKVKGAAAVVRLDALPDVPQWLLLDDLTPVSVAPPAPPEGAYDPADAALPTLSVEVRDGAWASRWRIAFGYVTGEVVGPGGPCVCEAFTVTESGIRTEDALRSYALARLAGERARAARAGAR